MKFPAFLLAASAVVGGVSAGQDELLYDVTFGSPPHVVGELTAVGGGALPRLTPTLINNGDPTVVAAFGPLLEQPCELGNGTTGYDQLRFTTGFEYGEDGLDVAYDVYRIELECVVDSLGAEIGNTVSFFLDAPVVHTIYFQHDGNIRTFASGGVSKEIGTYEKGTRIAVRTELDVVNQLWSIWIDDVLVYSETAPSCEELRTFRAHLSGEFADDAAAIDNVRIWGVNSEHCQTDLGYGGPGAATLGVCGDELVPGAAAELRVEGAAPLASGWVFVGRDFAPTSMLGGTLVPAPPAIAIHTMTDAAGALTHAVSSPGGPSTFYVQFAYMDASLPGGVGMTNAVEVVLLPQAADAVDRWSQTLASDADLLREGRP